MASTSVLVAAPMAGSKRSRRLASFLPLVGLAVLGRTACCLGQATASGTGNGRARNGNLSDERGGPGDVGGAESDFDASNCVVLQGATTYK